MSSLELSNLVSVEEVEPKIKCYEFSEKFMDQTVVYFQIFRFDSCLYIWIGNDRPTNSKHKYLSIALLNKFSSKVPLSTEILHVTSSETQIEEQIGQRIAQRLMLKFSTISSPFQAIYMSYNAEPQTVPELQIFVERRLVQFLKQNKFL